MDYGIEVNGLMKLWLLRRGRLPEDHSRGDAAGVIGTFLTVAFLTLKNRILQWVRRLRQPRYLIGAIAGAAYFWFLIFRRSSGNGKILLKTFSMIPVIADVASIFILLLMILPWALPDDSGGLQISEAEMTFLFPAPFRRRDLAHAGLAGGLAVHHPTQGDAHHRHRHDPHLHVTLLS